MVAIDADDRGGEDTAGVAGIEDQRETVTELLYDLLGAGAGWKAGEIGAGAGDGATDGFDERGGNFGIGPAESDASGVASDFQRQAMRGFDYKSEAARPEFIGEGEKTIGDVADETDGLLDRIY